MAALVLGIVAVMEIPREEEPQIVVPMLDVMTAMPGASPAEVEQRVTIPLETILREIPGVEYVYSTSSPGASLIIVRFYVGTRQEDAVVKVYSKLYANLDHIRARRFALHREVALHRRCADPRADTCGARTTTPTSCARLPPNWSTNQTGGRRLVRRRILGGQPRALRVDLEHREARLLIRCRPRGRCGPPASGQCKG